MTMKYRLPCLLIALTLTMAAAPVFGAQGGAEPLACAEKSIVASAVRTPEDVEAFVQCAYEHVQDVGFAEARRAFHEDERWRSGPIYVSVDEMTPLPQGISRFRLPARPSA